MDFMKLMGIPLPPSINEAYLNRAGFQGRGRIKSPKYRAFEREMFAWKLKRSQEISKATELIGPSGWLELNVDFMLPYSRVLTKDGRPKRHDVDNRLKVLNDAIASVLLFDDCRIARQTIQKIAVKGAEIGYVNVLIRKSTIGVSLG